MSFVIKHVTDLLPQWIESLNLEQKSNPGFRSESLFVSLCMRTLLPNIGPITPQKLPIRGAMRMKDFKDFKDFKVSSCAPISTELAARS
jgi:hypothetical protein